MAKRGAYVTFLTATHDEKDTYLVEVPDLEVLTEGYGIENAIYMARDAMGLAGITKEDMELDIPDPTPISKIDISKSTYLEIGNPIMTLVDIDFDEYRRKVDNKSVRRNITLPNWLNRAAEEAHINVSRVTQEALKEKLNIA